MNPIYRKVRVEIYFFANYGKMKILIKTKTAADSIAHTKIRHMGPGPYPNFWKKARQKV